MIKAVIFDFWGTLVENGTYSPLKQTYNILHVRMPFGSFVETFEKVFMGQEYASQFEGLTNAIEALRMRPKDFVIEKLIAVWNKNKLFAKPYPDTLKCLQELKQSGIKIALISNCPKDSTEYVVDKYNMGPFFNYLALSYREKCLKTDKAMFENVLENLEVTKEEVLVVGDSIETDIRGAESAELKAVLMDRRNTRQYQPKIRTLEELKKYLT